MKITLTIEVYGNDVCNVDFDIDYKPAVADVVRMFADDSHKGHPDELEIISASVSGLDLPEWFIDLIRSNKKIIKSLTEKAEKCYFENEMALDGITEALKRGW